MNAEGVNSGDGYVYLQPIDCEDVPGVLGCNDESACNFDESATLDDGSCDYVSCADACGVPNGDNGTCSGCMYEDAINYDSEALVDDGSCLVVMCEGEVVALPYDGGMVVEFEKTNYADWNLEENRDVITAVSYTHLTLPTKRIV